MKCPNCQREMKEGALFCEYCFHEIKMVPEFDAQLDDKINETMNSISSELQDDLQTAGDDPQSVPGTPKADFSETKQTTDEQISRKNRKKQTDEPNTRSRELPVLIACSAAVLFLVILGISIFRYTSSESYLVGRAYKLSSAGNYEDAITMIDRAASSKSADQSNLMLLKAEYLERLGRYHDADEVVLDIIKGQEDLGTDAREEILTQAYSRMISILTDQDDYQTIADRISLCTDENIRTIYHDYLTDMPAADMPSGNYEDELTITLSAAEGSSVFYTLDGTEPTTKSLYYNEPFTLPPGDYVLCAVAFNRFGAKGPVMTQQYHITTSAPEAPIVLTEEGEYTRAAMISVYVREHETVYYTIDGSDPTDESEVYEKPITMPIGTTTFKFIAYSDLGIFGPVKEVTYTMLPQGNISQEDGVNYILAVMIARGEILNAEGILPGGMTYASYQYTETWQLDGKGSYFLYKEIVTDLFGNALETGRIFAVNIMNGTVNIKGSGDELIPIG